MMPCNGCLGSRTRGAGLRAFTLLECVVVISIVTVLLAILIPAVQSVRAMAKKTQCLNNLRQIGLGLSNYSASFSSFPMAHAKGLSFHVMLLPFIEQVPLYNAINFNSGGWNSVDNSTAYRANLSVYSCSADSHLTADQQDFGWTSYAGNRGVGGQKYGENGAFQFPPGKVVALREFTDGTSTTAAVSEWILGSGPNRDRDPLRGTFHTPEPRTQPDEFELFASTCHALDTATARTNHNRKGYNWMRGDFGKTLYNHTLSLNDHTCLNGSAYQQGAWTAGSRHPGGANVLFADSSAHFVRQSVDLSVWRALGSRNGGETISEDSF